MKGSAESLSRSLPVLVPMSACITVNYNTTRFAVVAVPVRAFRCHQLQCPTQAELKAVDFLSALEE